MIAPPPPSPASGAGAMCMPRRTDGGRPGDFAVADPELVPRLFGKTGYELQLELLGTVVSPVTIEDVPPKSISRARSFLRTNDVSVLWAHTLRHLEYTVLKMRRQNLACREVSFWLRHWDDSSAGGHRKLPQPMNTEEQLRPYIRDLFDAFLKPKNSTLKRVLLSSDSLPMEALSIRCSKNPISTIANRVSSRHLTPSMSASVGTPSRAGRPFP